MASQQLNTFATLKPCSNPADCDRFHSHGCRTSRPRAQSALAAADLATAGALALLERDDVANMDAALRAHKFNPALRVVVRMFNTSLGEGLAQLPYCTVLSDTEIAAPAFVAAAIGEDMPTVRLRDGAFVVADRPGGARR